MFSSFLGMWIMSHLIWSGPTLLFNWADNLLILAKTKKGAKKASLALISAVGDLPGGNFQLKMEQPVLVSKGFTSLGHAIQRKKGKTTVRPAMPDKLLASVTKIQDEISDLVYGNKKNMTGAKALARVRVLDALCKIRSWKRAFKQCGPECVAEVTDTLENQLQTSWFEVLGISPMQANNYSNPEEAWLEPSS